MLNLQTARSRPEPLEAAHHELTDGVISVKQFGAVGDGVTDDTAAIQAAIAHVATFGTGPFPALFFPYGIYRVTSQLTSDQDFFRIKGAGHGRAAGSTTAVRGGSAILYDGPSLPIKQGVLQFGRPGDLSRGIAVEDISILCQDKAPGIYGYGLNLGAIRRVYIDSPTVGILLEEASYSSVIEDCEIYDASVGAIDLRSDCHSTDVIRCAFNSNASGSKTPAFGVQIAQDGNCSNVNILSSNFDMYRVTGAHVRVVQRCKGFTFVGNYIEGRDDGATTNLLVLAEGDGVLISGNRLTAAGSGIDYNIQVQAAATGVTITGNYFEGARVACVRIGNGASNVFVAGNATNGVAQVRNQNASNSKRATVIENGVVATDKVVTK